MGYRPVAAAKRLRTGRSNTIGMLIPQLRSGIFDRVLDGVRSELRLREGSDPYTVLVGVTDNRNDEQDALSRAIDSHDFDALILVSVAVPGDAALQRFSRRVVSIETSATGVPRVTYDMPAAFDDVVAHLRGLGHERIAHLYGLSKEVVSAQRDELIRAARRGGMTVEPVNAQEWSVSSAVDVVRPLLERTSESRPTAFFCDDVRLASAVYAVAHDVGLSVPEDLSVVCGNLDDVGLALRPRLSGLLRPAEEVGALAARMVLAQLDGTPGPIPVPQRCDLIINESTARVPVR